MYPIRRRWMGLVVAAMALAADASGQIDVTVRSLHPQLLQGEPFTVACRVVNRTMKPIVLGPDGNAELRVVAERRPGHYVRGSNQPVIEETVRIEPRRAEVFTVKLSRTHDVGRTGPYTLYGRVKTGDEIYRSSNAFVDVVPGLVLGSMRAAAPGEGRERRVFSLRALTRGGAERLFLRIDDDRSHRCYGVFDLGRLMSFFPPELEVDAAGRVHVLHLSSPTRYTHHVYGPNGEPVSAAFLARESDAAHLGADDEGIVTVRGASQLPAGESGRHPSIRTLVPFE